MGNKENPKVAIEVPAKIDVLSLKLFDALSKDAVRATLQRENKVSVYFNDKYYRTYHFVSKNINGIQVNKTTGHIHIYFD